MKHITFFLSALFLSFVGLSQSAIIELSKDSICAGESLTAEAFPPEYSLTTPTGTNNHNGVMFDVVATHSVAVNGFLITPLSSNSTLYVYYKTGSHVGYENSSTGWTLLDSVTGVAAGTAINPGFNMSQPMVAGQTLAFYVTSKGTNYIAYDNGTAVGNTLASDSYITIKEGVGKSYPFGGTYTPRNLVGAVLYSPSVVSYEWNTGQSVSQLTPSPQRSMFYSCEMELSSGASAYAYATVFVKELSVDASANPPLIQPGQSSTLLASVSLDRGVATSPAGSNSMNGAMFDIAASKNLTIYGLTISTTDSVDADLEVFYKTGTHVGFEANSSAWTSIGTFSGIPGGDGRYVSLNNPISMVGGQTVAVYITRTDAGGRLHYDNGTGVGNVAASGGGLEILEGKGIAYPFGTPYSPRVLNTIVHFEVDPVINATYNWSAGGTSASLLVTPTATTNYTVDVGLGGCTKVGNVTVTVSGVGVGENDAPSYAVFPNPASDFVVVQFYNNNELTEVSLNDLSGKTVYQCRVKTGEEEITIPVNGLAKGLYLLRLEQNNTPKFIKVNVL